MSLPCSSLANSNPKSISEELSCRGCWHGSLRVCVCVFGGSGELATITCKFGESSAGGGDLPIYNLTELRLLRSAIKLAEEMRFESRQVHGVCKEKDAMSVRRCGRALSACIWRVSRRRVARHRERRRAQLGRTSRASAGQRHTKAHKGTHTLPARPRRGTAHCVSSASRTAARPQRWLPTRLSVPWPLVVLLRAVPQSGRVCTHTRCCPHSHSDTQTHTRSDAFRPSFLTPSSPSIVSDPSSLFTHLFARIHSSTRLFVFLTLDRCSLLWIRRRLSSRLLLWSLGLICALPTLDHSTTGPRSS